METLGLILTILVLAAPLVQPFPNGAPSQACVDLQPQHGAPGGSQPPDNSPYELDVSLFEDIRVENHLVARTFSYTPGRSHNRKSVSQITCKHVCLIIIISVTGSGGVGGVGGAPPIRSLSSPQIYESEHKKLMHNFTAFNSSLN